MSRTWLAGVAAGLLALSVAACGGDDSAGGDGTATTAAAVDSTGAPAPTDAPAATDAAPAGTDAPVDSGTFPVTVSGGLGDVTLDEAPSRIVSISATHTEMLYAIGAGDQVAALDSLSTYPPETADKVTEISAYEPSVEAISEYEPDLVLVPEGSDAIAQQLQTLGIPVWMGNAAATFEDVYTQIEQLGALTGNVGEAAALVADMTAQIDDIVASVPPLEEPLTFYHELDDTYYSVTSNTFIGAVYSLLGLRNIADTAEGQSDYPQLSAEFIVSQDPDIVFLADTVCCGQTAETVAARPGWDQMTAVREGHVVEMNDDIASRWGPRIVDYLREAAAAVEAVASGQPVAG